MECVTKMKTGVNYQFFLEIIKQFDLGCKYVNDYNTLLHDYNGIVLYQAESQFINAIGKKPGITITELASFFDKTPSACSQLMRRMKNKGWLFQQRNNENNREFKLFLTEEGEQIYHCHQDFENRCYLRTASMLEGFTDEELMIYIKIQERLNAAFLQDVEESRHIAGNALSKLNS